MSGPNTSYDPVEVAALDPEAVDAAVARGPRRARPPPATSTSSRPPASPTRATRARWPSPTGRSARCPPSAKADAGKRVGAGPRPGRRGRSPLARPSSRPSGTHGSSSRRRSTSPCPACRAARSARATPSRSSPSGSRTSSSAWVGRSPRGPEVEAEWLNFDALNFGPDHPARQMQDTFFVEPPGLRARPAHPHLAGAGPHDARRRSPPIYVLCPGKVFRTDELDATHTPVFHQFEGLVVDEGITMAHLKGSLDAFVQQPLRRRTPSTRLRPSYFPFTEPSAEIDCRCWVCHGDDPGVPDLRGHRVDRVRRLRHGQPPRARRERDRPRPLHRLRLRARHRALAHAARTASPTCTTSSRETCASRAQFGMEI